MPRPGELVRAPVRRARARLPQAAGSGLPGQHVGQQVSMGEALSHLVDATERVVTERVDLARLEAEHKLAELGDEIGERCARAVRGGTLIGSGAVLAIGGWFILMAAAIVVLHRWLVLDASIAIVGGANLLLALPLIGRGAAVLRRPLAGGEKP
ncbi:MAG TPA: phage holin family protein [Caldimonas sp.]|nr:phage holin family protein [Caldimonas sp.]